MFKWAKDLYRKFSRDIQMDIRCRKRCTIPLTIKEMHIETTMRYHFTSLVWLESKRQINGLVAQMIKNPPAVQKTPVWSLGWEDLLENDMATHSNILAWRIPWTEEPHWLKSKGLQRVRHDWVVKHACVQ